MQRAPRLRTCIEKLTAAADAYENDTITLKEFNLMQGRAMLCFQHKINEEVQRWKDNIAVLEKEVAELERQKAELSEQTKREEKSQERAQAEDAAGQQATMTDKPEQTQQYADSAEQLPEEQEEEREQADDSDSVEENEETQDIISEKDSERQRCIQEAPLVVYQPLPDRYATEHAAEYADDSGSDEEVDEPEPIPAKVDPRLHELWPEMYWIGTKDNEGSTDNILLWNIGAIQGEIANRNKKIAALEEQVTYPYTNQLSWLKQEFPNDTTIDVMYEAMQTIAGGLNAMGRGSLKRKRTGNVCKALVLEHVQIPSECAEHVYQKDRLIRARDLKQKIINEDKDKVPTPSSSSTPAPRRTSSAAQRQRKIQAKALKHC